MKILFITQFYPPEMGAAASRISGLGRNISSFGNEVTVLTGFPNYPSGVIGKKYRFKLFSVENDGNVRVNRVWVFASPLRKFYTRLLNYFSLVFTTIIFELFNKQDYQKVIVSSPPLFLGIAGYVISRLKGACFVLDIRDIWPKIGVDTGELKKESIFIKLAEKLEIFLYNMADLVTVVTESKKQYLLENGISESKISVIPNGVDREYLDVEVNPGIESSYFNDSCFTILYAGLVGIAQGVDVIVEAANLLKTTEGIRFIIVGEGVKKGEIIKLAEDFGLSNVMFIDNQPKERIATFLKRCDLSIIPLKKASFSDSVPSKLLESMGFGCPVVLSASGESATIVERSGGGVVTEPGNAKELADAILRLYGNAELRIQFSKNGKVFVARNFMRDDIAKKFVKVLKDK